MRVEVAPSLLSSIDGRIAREHEKKLYRPEVVAITECINGTILLVESRKGRYWGFPQGGVREGEGIINGLFRELHEETGIQKETLTVRNLCFSILIDIHNRQHREGFRRGKSFYFLHVLCCRRPDIVLQTSEVVDYQWLPPEQAIETITAYGTEHWEKRDSMLTALRMALGTRRS